MAAGSGRRFKWLTGAALLIAALWFAFGREGGYLIVNDPPAGQGPIVAFGDSLVAGHGASPGEGFVEVLSSRIGETLINRGVEGDTVGDGAARLERDVLAVHPRIVLICLGGNDLLRRHPPKDVFPAYERMIRRIQGQGALVILIMIEARWVPGGGDYAREYRALARRTGSAAVPNIFKGFLGNRAIMSDSIHPNAQGYVIMADRIEPVLRKYAGKP